MQATTFVMLTEEELAKRWNRPRCTGEHTHEALWSKSELLAKPELKQCKHGAVVRVNGKPMCRIHAGFAALKIGVTRGVLG